MIHSEPMKPRGSMLPSISLVTPSYNQGQFLEQTMRSILDQNYPNLEYVVIDGGSTDNSVKIIKKYASRLKYWASEPDKGQADAINKGFKKTSGEIMGWINSDDVLMPGSLELIAKIFDSLPQVDWISCTPQTLNRYGYIHHLCRRPVYIQQFIKRGWYHGRGLGFIMQEGTFWRRSLWKKVGSKVNNFHYGMDFDLWKRFAQTSSPLPVHVPLAGFRLNPNRKTKAMDKYHQEMGVQVPKLLIPLAKVLRLSLQIPRKLRLTRQFFYDLRTESWVYVPDIFSRIQGKEKIQRF